MSLTIKFLDIGLGTSILIESSETNIIFDCGQDSGNEKNSFKELGDKTLHLLVLTHPHKDHIGSLISRYYVNPLQIKKNNYIPKYLIEKQIDEANNRHDKWVFHKYKELNDMYTQSVPYEKSYNNPNNNGKIFITHFTPYFRDSEDLNDYSLATFLLYEGYKMLLMGDNTPKNIVKLMNDRYFKNKIKNIDVLLAPHHGRESCYVSEFVKHVNPTITIISDSSEINNESASNKYTDNCEGMYVTKNGKREFRACLTTRNDGDITLTIDDSKKLSIICIK